MNSSINDFNQRIDFERSKIEQSEATTESGSKNRGSSINSSNRISNSPISEPISIVNSKPKQKKIITELDFRIIRKNLTRLIKNPSSGRRQQHNKFSGLETGESKRYFEGNNHQQTLAVNEGKKTNPGGGRKELKPKKREFIKEIKLKDLKKGFKKLKRSFLNKFEPYKKTDSQVAQISPEKSRETLGIPAELIPLKSLQKQNDISSNITAVEPLQETEIEINEKLARNMRVLKERPDGCNEYKPLALRINTREHITLALKKSEALTGYIKAHREKYGENCEIIIKYAYLLGLNIDDKTNMSNVTFCNSDMRYMSITNFNCEKLKIDKCDMTNAKILYSTFKEVNIADSCLDDTVISQLFLPESKIFNSTFKKACIVGGGFTNKPTLDTPNSATPSTSSFSKIDKADFNGATIDNFKFHDVALSEADFQNAKMSSCEHKGSSIINGSYKDAIMRQMNLADAIISDSNFENSKILGGNAGNATIVNVNFDGSDIKDFGLKSAKVDSCSFKNLKGFRDSTLPGGIEYTLAPSAQK